MNYELIKNNICKYDYYLAGPFFNEQQLDMQRKIEQIMVANGKRCFSPRKDAGTLGKNPTLEDMDKVFKADLDAINHCKYLFANVSFRDTGTSVEIGYALSRNIPIILYWDEDIHDSDHVNLMIVAACGCKYIKNWKQLNDYLKFKELPDNELQFKVE